MLVFGTVSHSRALWFKPDLPTGTEDDPLMVEPNEEGGKEEEEG